MEEKTAGFMKSREAALKALVRVEQDGAYLNLVLPALSGNMPPAERALALQLAAGTVQRLNTLDWAISHFSRRPLGSFTPWIRNILRLGAYQLLYLDRVPAYAAISEAVLLARRFGHRGVAGLVNGLLRNLSRKTEALPWPDPGLYPVKYLSLKYSQPQWLVSRSIKRLGFTETEMWCRANNNKAPASIRPNLMRTGVEDLMKKLKTEGVGAVHSPLVPGALRILSGGAPAATEAFREGLFTVQGESSALVAPLLGPQPGDSIVDLCSAPGGKATHLAELINDTGVVFAVDSHGGRLGLVEKAARRLGLKCVQPLHADGRTLTKQNITTPQAVLVDAPCSGLGVIRRLPEIKWRRREADLTAMQKKQVELLFAAARLLPVGGKLLYSVCSVEPEETRQVVEIFYREHSHFIHEQLATLLPLPLQKDQDVSHLISLWPHRHNMDGFFMALWSRKR